MADSIVAPYGLETNNPQPEIKRYYNLAKTPYTNTTQVLSEVLLAVRYLGQTFLVDNEEWWFKEGTTDEDLVLKENLEGFVPLSGTEVGKPITGSLEGNSEFFTIFTGDYLTANTETSYIEMIENSSIAFRNKSDNYTCRLDLGGGGASLGVSESTELLGKSLEILYSDGEGIRVNDTKDNIGLKGNAFFNKQNDPNAFAQLGDITEATDLIEDQLETKQDKPIIISANKTAVNDEVYHNTGNNTYTDPTGVTGKGFSVKVISGTATIGGVDFGIGTIIERDYDGSEWKNEVYVSAKNQVEFSGNKTVVTTWFGKEVTCVSSGVLTIPASLPDEFNFCLRADPGTTISWAITSPHTWRVMGLAVGVAPATMTAGQFCQVSKRKGTNEIRISGL